MLSKRTIKDEIDSILREMGFNLAQIILFGSRAKGNFSQFSDWDILVIVKEDIDRKLKKRIWHTIYSRLHNRFPKASFDIFIKPEREFEDEKFVVNTLSNEAIEEGMIL